MNPKRTEKATAAALSQVLSDLEKQQKRVSELASAVNALRKDVDNLRAQVKASSQPAVAHTGMGLTIPVPGNIDLILKLDKQSKDLEAKSKEYDEANHFVEILKAKKEGASEARRWAKKWAAGFLKAQGLCVLFSMDAEQTLAEDWTR